MDIFLVLLTVFPCPRVWYLNNTKRLLVILTILLVNPVGAKLEERYI